ncbi:hypothetical protein HYX07_02420 [Candidatus Woesearchaeota archaeon]|nr:hypothetical protein [Candidatus Woesearchaeota archaeon]
MGRLVNIIFALALAAGTAHAEVKQNNDPVKLSDLRPLSSNYDPRFRELIKNCEDFWLHENASEFHVRGGKCYVASSIPGYKILEK